MKKKYIFFVYSMIVLFLILSIFSLIKFPDAFVVLYLIGAVLIPVYAAHFCSGFILGALGIGSESSSWMARFALLHPDFLKIIYFGVRDDRFDSQVLAFCRNCHFIGALGVVSFFFLGRFK